MNTNPPQYKEAIASFEEAIKLIKADPKQYKNEVLYEIKLSLGYC